MGEAWKSPRIWNSWIGTSWSEMLLLQLQQLQEKGENWDLLQVPKGTPATWSTCPGCSFAPRTQWGKTSEDGCGSQASSSDARWALELSHLLQGEAHGESKVPLLRWNTLSISSLQIETSICCAEIYTMVVTGIFSQWPQGEQKRTHFITVKYQAAIFL